MDAKEFARRFTTPWTVVIPLLDPVVRHLDANAIEWELPLPSSVDPQRRGLVAELAFGVFSQFISDGREYGWEDRQVDQSVVDAVALNMEMITGLSSDRFLNIRDREHWEALAMGNRLVSHLRDRLPEGLTVQPTFAGCGIVDESRGDLLAGSTLIEVKAVERSFRPVDLRQVLVYLALNHASRNAAIDRLSLLNPRTGRLIAIEVEELALQAGGRSATEIFDDLVDWFEGNELSAGN